MLRDHPIRQTDHDTDYVSFGNPFPVTRVAATMASVKNAAAYESLTCREEIAGEHLADEQLANSRPQRDASGQLVWGWRKAPPVTQQDERRWLKQGLIRIEEARYLPRDANSPESNRRDAFRHRAVERLAKAVGDDCH